MFFQIFTYGNNIPDEISKNAHTNWYNEILITLVKEQIYNSLKYLWRDTMNCTEQEVCEWIEEVKWIKINHYEQY